MASVVIIIPCENSIVFQKKFIKLEFGQSVVLGRADDVNLALKTNGFFESPPSIKVPVLSRRHALLVCHKDGVYMRSCHKNSFLNGERMEVDVMTKIVHPSVLVLGGYASMDSTAIAGGSVACSVSIFDEHDENVKYFLLLERDYPFPFTWPDEPPNYSMGIETLYAATYDRLKVLERLAEFSETELDSHLCDTSTAENEQLKSYLELLLDDFEHYASLYEARMKDFASQFVLAVGCCRNARTRNWFIAQEMKLFTLKWKTLLPYEQLAILEMLKLDHEEVPDGEIQNLTGQYPLFFPASAKYYKVPFSEVPTFVKRRRAYLVGGFCFVSLQDMYAPLIKRLRMKLWDLTKVARSKLDKIWYDERIREIIRYVDRNVGDPDRYQPKISGEKVTEHNIHKLCDESFPLCMKVLQYHLSRDQHLRNGGRFQYTLFLKGIGLDMTGSLRFWKAHFTKKIEENVFMKKYSYHIRHAYGEEGKMANYPPQSCADIMAATPGPLEYHGCPFKVLDEIRMKEAMHRSGLKKEVYTELLDLAKRGTPQDACKRYFELTQGESYSYQTVTHPNIYYDESRKVLRARKAPVTITFETSMPAKSNQNPVPCPAPVHLEW